MSSDGFIEGIVCKDSDIAENEMKTFQIGDEGDEILLVRQNGKLNALGAKCPHLKAPLVEGVLGKGRIRCQLHGACFNLLNGDIEDFPGVNSLPCYQVTIENDQVKVRAKRDELKSDKRVKSMTKRDAKESQHIVVIGGGPSGAICVETLRQEGFKGKITLICKENYLPYNRVVVNKRMDIPPSFAEYRNEQFYKENSIEILKGVEATSVNITQKTAKLSNGQTLSYNKLYIATGSRANKPKIPGVNLRNIFTLCTLDDSQKVSKVLNENSKVVILGGSFIALESAAYCLDNKITDITVVMRGNVPFEATLGEKIGTAFKKTFEDRGVTFIPNSGIQRFADNIGEGKVTQVELLDGTILDTNLVIMGVGSIYNTEFLKGSGIQIRPNGSIEVNDYLQSNNSSVYVGGDIAYAPVFSSNNRKAAIGHYSLSQYHGKIAGLNMSGKVTKLKSVPFFGSKMSEIHCRYVGHGKFNDIIYVGDVDNLKFVAYYLDGDEVVGVSSVDRDPVAAQFAELLAQGKKLYRKHVEGDDDFTWSKKILQ